MLFLCMQSHPVWSTLAVARPVRLSTSHTGHSPVMAAEEFLPAGKLETVSFVDTTFGSPLFMHRVATSTATLRQGFVSRARVVINSITPTHT